MYQTTEGCADNIAVCGVDLAAGRGVTEVAALDLPAEDGTPVFDLPRHRRVVTDEDILAALVAAGPRVIAIDAPLSLPRSVAAALGGGPSVATSPYTRAAERDPLWSSLGIRPLPVSFLGGLTFRAVVLRARLRAALPDAAIVETFPSATLALLGVRPARWGTGRGAKTTPAVRAETQRGLARWIAGVPDPADERLDEPLGADLLDALAAALVAGAYLRGASLAVGDASEGQIILPDSDRFRCASTGE